MEIQKNLRQNLGPDLAGFGTFEIQGGGEIGVKMIISENDENKKNGWRFFWKYVLYPNIFWKICVVPQQITQNMCCPPTQCPSGTRTVYL